MILRIVFVGVIAQLMLLPYLKLVGGAALLVIAAKLVVPDDPDKDEIQAAAHLWRAVMIIVVADIVMSLDNIIAIAAIAQGNLLLLVIGLAVSIPLIMAGAALITVLLDRFPILIWAGSALLGWVAGGVIATDPAVARSSRCRFRRETSRTKPRWRRPAPRRCLQSRRADCGSVCTKPPKCVPTPRAQERVSRRAHAHRHDEFRSYASAIGADQQPRLRRIFRACLLRNRILVIRSVLPCRHNRLGLLRFGLPPKI